MPNFYVRHSRVPSEKRKFRVYSPWWVDPNIFIQGSSIEKMVMAELVRRNIYFQHTPQKNDLGGFVDPSWEADFLFPQYKIWLEINGSYFHSLPGQIETDALRGAAITMAGWRYLAWWEWDIRTRLIDLFNEVPEFRTVKIAKNQKAADKYGTNQDGWFEGGDGVDHLKGLRAALSGRAQPVQLIMRRHRTRLRMPK